MVTVPNLVDETPLDQYTATASQTDFNFTYMIFATADIKVYVNGVLKTETTDYVVKKSDGSAIVPADDLPMDGGKVVFNSGLTLNDEVSLSRDIAIQRLTGYSVAGAFRADVVNAEFTKLYAVQQQLERDLARSVRLSASDSEGGSLELPSSRANKFLAFDASGNMIASAGSADSIPVSTFMATVLDDTTAAAARSTLGAQAQDDDLDDIAALTVARGDILIGNSTPEWSNLAVGSADEVLVSDGTDISWGTVPRTLRSVQVFISSDTYTKPAGINAIVVEVQAGGGGGGGASSSVSCAGGGAGGYSRKLITTGIGATETVTVGAGGTGGAGGGNNGSSGGFSSFGAHCSATGGGGGFTNGTSGVGGIGSSGDVNLRGNAGQSVAPSAAGTGGAGGPSIFGGSGRGQAGAGAAAEDGSGAGGAGGLNSLAGGDGGDGRVIVWEYS